MEFSNKTAIVTGAASGMGLLFSQRFADEGGRVVMVDINGDALKSAAAEIERLTPAQRLPLSVMSDTMMKYARFVPILLKPSAPST